MPFHYPLQETGFRLPETLIREYRIDGVAEDGSIVTLEVDNNHQRLVRHTVDWCVKEVRFVPIATHGCEEFRLFGFEIA